MNDISISYVTTLPKGGNSPRVKITGNNDELYNIYYYDNNKLYLSGQCKTNQIFIGKSKQYYTNWFIKVEDSNNQIQFIDKFNPEHKTIFIKMDAYALGDTIAWIPYVEEFRVKHNCSIICSTFHNDILIDSYPNILFVQPNTTIHNVYAQYYIGADTTNNKLYSPVNVNDVPLQMVASSILGLDYKEIRPDLTNPVKHSKPNINGKYVTLSEFGSSDIKSWKYENGWQMVVDFLNDNGYKVIVISKEKTSLENVIDMSGDHPLINRMIDIYHADFHIGVSSGLSWLAWSLNKHVVMISDVTPNFHEFKSNITRINSNDIKSVNYNIDELNVTHIKNVIDKLTFLVG